MKQKVIAVVGGKKVGKTTTAENLIAEFTRRGYRVAALKHISEPDWTIDTEGKDTWRFTHNGAQTVVAVGNNEIATIEKGSTEKISLKTLLKKVKDYDLVVSEGLKKQVGKKRSIPKIAVTTNQQQAEQALKMYKPLLAFSGPYNPQEITDTVPYIDGLKNPQKLTDLAEKTLQNQTPT
ncbi:MAG: molybdopterin-guanine dinucleotide biosynthesis protein B [Candidatus Bathyarchaeota archaeon]|nr:molybdopterin-guanine dinucleotide biosynthesis protein B [Candidatus Bathyarchaeota archaeon]